MEAARRAPAGTTGSFTPAALSIPLFRFISY